MVISISSRFSFLNLYIATGRDAVQEEEEDYGLFPLYGGDFQPAPAPEEAYYEEEEDQLNSRRDRILQSQFGLAPTRRAPRGKPNIV